MEASWAAQELANLLWSYATLAHYPGDALLEAMALHMAERIQAYRPQAVSNSLWAYAKVRAARRLSAHAELLQHRDGAHGGFNVGWRRQSWVLCCS